MIELCSGMFAMSQLLPSTLITVMRSSIIARVLQTRSAKSYITSSNTPPTQRRRRLGGYKFPSLCDGSGKNLLKSERHTFACHYKTQAWTLKSYWSGSRNRVRFDYILERRFGMFNLTQANLQLLSSFVILLLVLYVAGTAPLAGLCESPIIFTRLSQGCKL